VSEERMSTYETEQPWLCYHYGATHDKWWPFWNSTRVLGIFKINMECCVCGEYRMTRIKIPRFGEVPAPKGGASPSASAVHVGSSAPRQGPPDVVGKTSPQSVRTSGGDQPGPLGCPPRS
jgi:hypothetical protein